MKAIDQPRPTLYTCTPTLITKFIVVLHNITIEEEGLSFDDMGEDIPDSDTPLLQGVGGMCNVLTRELISELRFGTNLCLFLIMLKELLIGKKYFFNQVIVNTIDWVLR